MEGTKTEAAITRWQAGLLLVSLLAYLLARFSQLFADKLSSLLIVVLHVIPPAAFALIHGSILYRVRGILTFAAFCLGIGALSESFSLRTGFPFGEYYFTGVMGPKLFDVPVLLMLAYLGIGYISWILSLLILGYQDKPITGGRVVTLPLLAGFLMLAWDLSMEAGWSTVDRAWVWKSGGPFFGVPLSNFFGWYLTAYLFYQAFALRHKAKPAVRHPFAPAYWDSAILFYAICALGNLLVLRVPMIPAVVADASGRQWMTIDVLETCALFSLVLMAPMALLAWLRFKKEQRGLDADQPRVVP